MDRMLQAYMAAHDRLHPRSRTGGSRKPRMDGALRLTRRTLEADGGYRVHFSAKVSTRLTFDGGFGDNLRRSLRLVECKILRLGGTGRD